MRRAGAAGDDWSDWDKHMPLSPCSSGHPDDSLGSSSLSRSLSKQTSDKFELAEGTIITLNATPSACLFGAKGSCPFNQQSHLAVAFLAIQLYPPHHKFLFGLSDGCLVLLSCSRYP